MDRNNRQLHADQVRLVQAQAKKLAGQQGLTAAEWEKRLLTQLAYQNSEMYVRYGNDPQAEAILTTLQSQSGVQMDYRATAAYRNDALNMQYLPQLTHAYQQLPPLNGSMSQAQFARYAGLLSGDFARIPPAAQREVVQQLQGEYQTTLKQQLAQDQAGQSAGGQALQLAVRLEVLNKLLATAEYAAVRSGAISESEASAMQRAMAAGMLVPSQGVNAKPQGVPPAKGQVVAGENMPAGQRPVSAGVRVDAAVEVGAHSEVVAQYGPLNPGPLSADFANTFRSGTYSEVVTQQPTTLYRVYGGNAGQLGSYWTKTPPSGSVQSIIDSALNPSWGNTATRVVAVEIPVGTRFYQGFSASQGGLVGGGSQVLFPSGFKIDPAWIKMP